MSNKESLIYAAEVGYLAEGGQVRHPKSSRPLTLHYNPNGYPFFTVENRTRKIKGTVPVHRLVAYYKFGEKVFEDNIQVRHRDGNQKNFEKDNILLGTQSQNMMDRPEFDRKRIAAYARNCFRPDRFSDDDIVQMREMRHSGSSLNEIARAFNTGKSYISMLTRGLVRSNAGGIITK